MSNQEIDYEVMDVEQLRERVSLLEMKLAFERDWRKGQEELASRIAKAKAILEGFRVTEFGKVADPVIDDVLAALEGK